MKIMINGVERDATPEEEAEILAAQAAASPVLTPEEKRALLPDLPSRQFWLGALTIGITEDSLVARIAAEVADEFERNWLITEVRKATSFSRLSPSVVELAELESIPPEQLDDLWVWSRAL